MERLLLPLKKLIKISRNMSTPVNHTFTGFSVFVPSLVQFSSLDSFNSLKNNLNNNLNTIINKALRIRKNINSII